MTGFRQRTLAIVDRCTRIIGGVGERDVEEFGEAFGHVALADHAEPGDDRALALAALTPQRHHAVALDRVESAAGRIRHARSGSAGQGSGGGASVERRRGPESPYPR